MRSVDALRTAAEPIFEAEPIVFAYLFGSAATGRTHARSDVDVAVMLGDDAGDPVDVALRLAGNLGRVAGTTVDIVALNDAPLPLVGRVLRDRVVLFSRDETARVRYEVRMFKAFIDFQIHAEPLDHALIKARGSR